MSGMTVELDEKAYGQLLGRTLLRLIRSDEKHKRFTSELMRLDEREDLTPEERELAELLTLLIEKYEERSFPIRKAGPHPVLRHLMEARNLSQKDLWKLFGSKGITSEVFSRQALDQQNTGEKAGSVLPSQRGPVHLGAT